MCVGGKVSELLYLTLISRSEINPPFSVLTPIHLGKTNNSSAAGLFDFHPSCIER